MVSTVEVEVRDAKQTAERGNRRARSVRDAMEVMRGDEKLKEGRSCDQ